MKNRAMREHSGAALLLAACLILFYRDVVFGGRSFFMLNIAAGTMAGLGAYEYPGPKVSQSSVTDAGALAWAIEPAVYLTRRVLQEGELPLWNPNTLFGVPHLGGGQSGVFDPLLFPSYVCPREFYPLVSDIQVLLRFWLAGFFTYLFTRSLGLGFWAALFGGCSMMHFEYGFTFGNHASFRAFTTLPALLFALERCVQSPSRGRVIVATMVASWTVLSDFAEASFLVLVTATAWYVYRAAWSAWEGVGRPRWKGISSLFRGHIWRLTVILGGAVCISSPMVVEFLWSLAQSVHAHDSGAGMETQSRALMILNLIPPYTAVSRPFSIVSLHLGSLALALVGVLSSWRLTHGKRITVFWLAVFVVLYAKQFGFPQVQWIGMLPGFSQIKLLRDVSGILETALAVLAALGVEAFARRKAGGGTAFAAHIAFLGVLAYFLSQTSIDTWGGLDKFVFVLMAALLFMSLPLIVAAVLSVWGRRTCWLGLGLIASLVAEVNFWHRDRERCLRYDPYRVPPFVEFLNRQPKPFRIFGWGEFLFPNISSAYGIDDLRALLGLVPARAWRYVTDFVTATPDIMRLTGSESSLFLGRYFDLAGIEYFVIPPHYRTDGFDTRMVSELKQFENTPAQAIETVEFQGMSGVRALKAVPGSRVSLKFRLPDEGQHVHLHFGVWAAADTGSEGAVQALPYRVILSDREGEQEILRREVPVRGANRRKAWDYQRVDVSRWRGERVTLSLVAERPEGQAGAGIHVLWALPIATYQDPLNVWASPGRLDPEHISLNDSIGDRYVFDRSILYRSRRVEINGSIRSALLFPPDPDDPGSKREGELELQLPEAAADLAFSLGFAAPAPGGDRAPSNPLELRVELSESAEFETIHSETVDLGPDPALWTWLDRAVDLSRWKGRAVRLRFSSRPAVAGAKGLDFARWGDIELRPSAGQAFGPADLERFPVRRFELAFDRELKIVHNRNAFPRAFLVHRVVRTKDQEESHQRMLSANFDLASRAAVELAEEDAIPEVLLSPGPAPPPSAAVLMELGVNRLKFRTAPSEPGLLVVSNLAYDGWHVLVDGQAATIHPVDGALQGVILPGGSHVVELYYLPFRFTLALALSACTLIGMAAWGAAPRRRSSGSGHDSANTGAKAIPPENLSENPSRSEETQVSAPLYAQAASNSLEPERKPPFNRASAAWSVLVFGITLGVYLTWMPRFLRFSSPPTGDQPFYLMDVASLSQDRDLNVKNNYDQSDFDKFYSLAPHPPGFVGISAPYPLGRQLAPNSIRPRREQYSHHLPGLPILLFPAWKIGGQFRLWWPATIVGMFVLSALLAVNVFQFAFQVSSSRWAAVAVWLAISFSNPVMTFSYLIFTELCVGLLFLYALRRLSLGWEANGGDRLLLVGLCIGFIPWVAWRCVLLSATLVGYAFWQWRAAIRAARGTDAAVGSLRRRRSASILLVLVPVIVSAAAILRFHYFLYGKPFPDMRVPELGSAPPFDWPWLGATEFTSFFANSFALFFDMTFGLLPWAPVFVLSIAGAVAMLRSSSESTRRLVPVLLAVVLPYLGALAAFKFWHGIWCPPARYLTSLVPLCAAPLAAFLASGPSRWRRAACLLLFLCLAAPGWGWMGLLLHDARRIWPSSVSPALEWLAAQRFSFGSFDLRPWIPAFITPDETRLPGLLGGWLGASAVVVLLASALASRRRASRTRALLGWAGALAVVGAAWLVVSFPYLKHKTELVEKGRWYIGGSQEDPRGIAHLDGKIYVACYGTRLPSGASDPGRVLVVDLKTGKSSTMPLTSAGVSQAWEAPGDVKVGPDGVLYVLNNGPGDRALLVVRPDGEVVRQFATPANTAVAKGMSTPRDRTLYVSDMVGGAVRKYVLPASGSGIPEFRTISEGLSNPSAVEVDNQGRILVAESYRWVQQLAVDGATSRKLEKCSVRSFAVQSIAGDWIEASCENSLFSIDARDSTLQMARVRSGAPLQGIITAITYGSDGLLYTLQGGTLVAYQVTH